MYVNNYDVGIETLPTPTITLLLLLLLLLLLARNAACISGYPAVPALTYDAGRHYTCAPFRSIIIQNDYFCMLSRYLTIHLVICLCVYHQLCGHIISHISALMAQQNDISSTSTCSACLRFLAKKVNMSTFDVTCHSVAPYRNNPTRIRYTEVLICQVSEGTLVAAMHRYFYVQIESTGNRNVLAFFPPKKRASVVMWCNCNMQLLTGTCKVLCCNTSAVIPQ